MAEPVTDAEDLVARVADEFRARRARGETPDPEEFAARYPGAAPVLRRVLGMFRLLTPAAPRPVPGRLGDFRVLREVGRGGMGVVYEAEQISLGRRVALKVLPPGAVLDPVRLRRFENEARAAAALDHPNVVKVHAVGSDAGTHFYAMQFIDGGTAADLISAGRRPADPFATAARIAAEAADALEHAHALGIVHRDVKPGNLLIDRSGKAWVADFGLARLGPGDGATGSGTVIGTLRYMSPEQALAKHGLVDHRTDVYGLGATLYELLTGRPAVGGRDNAEVLRALAQDDPAPPRKLDPSVPRDLETICLKCLEKEPARRYPTAGELADDLRRYLAGEPIRARPPSVADRAAKWVRRNRALVAATAAGLLLALVTLAAAVVVVLGQRDQARQDKEAAQREKEAAERERARAEANLRKAFAAVDRLLTRAGQKTLANEPRMERLRRDFLEEALRLCQEILDENARDPRARLEVAAAHRRVGNIRATLGEHDRAEQAYRAAEAVLEQLIGESPDDTPARWELVRVQRLWANLLVPVGRLGEAETRIRRAIELADGLSAPADDPSARSQLPKAYNTLAVIHHRAMRAAEAERANRTAIEGFRALLVTNPDDHDGHNALANTLNNLAINHLVRDPASRPACALLEEAAAHQRTALKHGPDNIEYRIALRDTLQNLSITQAHLGAGDSAVENLRQVVAISEEFAKEFPNVPDNRVGLFQNYFNWGQFRKDHDRREAESLFRRALEIGEKLVGDYPAVIDYRDELGRGCVLFAEFIRGERPDEALKAYGRAVELYEGLDRARPSPQVRARLAGALSWVGNLHRDARHYREAERAYVRVLNVREKLAADSPTEANHRALAAVCASVGFLRVTVLDPEYRRAAGVIALAERATRLDPKQPDYWDLLGLARYRTGDLPGSFDAFETARKLGKPAGAMGFAMAALAWQLGEKDAARKLYTQAVAWSEQNGTEPELRGLRGEAAVVLGFEQILPPREVARPKN